MCFLLARETKGLPPIGNLNWDSRGIRPWKFLLHSLMSLMSMHQKYYQGKQVPMINKVLFIVRRPLLRSRENLQNLATMHCCHKLLSVGACLKCIPARMAAFRGFIMEGGSWRGPVKDSPLNRWTRSQINSEQMHSVYVIFMLFVSLLR